MALRQRFATPEIDPTATGFVLPAAWDRTGDPEQVPDIIEFVTDHRFLNRTIYPRQATILKVMFLAKHLFTQFDYDVIGEWTEGFKLPSNPVSNNPEDDAVLRYVGDWGIVPDILERIDYLLDMGYSWFQVALMVLGRRASKGFIGSLAHAYVLWRHLNRGNPRDHYAIDRDKRLATQVFAGKKMQARDNQWRDIVNVINGAPCYLPYLSQSLGESLTVFSPLDLERMAQGKMADSNMDLATFEVVPKEATTMAARGPASYAQFYDEMAHMVQTSGGSDSAEKVWDSAQPSLEQLGKDQFSYCGSSPWTMTGKFYELCQQALEVDADTRKPIYPERMLIQLESWAIYEDWERTKIAFPLRPAYDTVNPIGEPVHKEEIIAQPLKKAIIVYDERMQRLERANPETFKVEFRAKWATAMDAYFPERHVRRMFDPFDPNDPLNLEGNATRLSMASKGAATIDYVAHGDPGKTGSNFGFAIGHRISVPNSPLPHVVLDVVKPWMPGDFPNLEMDYTVIEEELKGYIDDFLPVSMSFDQWNSLGLIQRLSAHARKNFKVTRVWERSTTAPLNWKTAETMKTALSLNLIHAPWNELFELECLFLRKMPGDKVDHPTSGPVTTKDVYDAVSIVIHELIGDDVASYLASLLSAIEPAVGMPGPSHPEHTSSVAAQFGQLSNASLAGAKTSAYGRQTRPTGSPTGWNPGGRRR